MLLYHISVTVVNVISLLKLTMYFLKFENFFLRLRFKVINVSNILNIENLKIIKNDKQIITTF